LEDTKAYGYAELIIEKMLDTDISYFTVISSDIYRSHYQLQEQTTTYTKVSQDLTTASPAPTASAKSGKYKASVTMRINMISDSFQNQLADLSSDESKIMDFIKEQYDQEGLVSNLTVYNKIGYLEAYQKIDAAYYHYWGIPGSYTDKLFTVDTESASRFIKKLQNRQETYTEAQSFGKTVSKKKQISSKGKKILILNGSKISGLASSKQTELTRAGFTVPKVGDYTREVLTQTRIIVPKRRMGNDLTEYFKNPEIVVGEVESGYDIEIILGTVDAN
jgi:hypothetical protein